MTRLRKKYDDEICSHLKKELNLKTIMEVPRLIKIVLNMGVGEAVVDKKVLDFAVSDLTKISGQKPVITRASKSIAGFKIRDGYPIGCKTTLRHDRMYEFLDRLNSIVLPAVRDFRGLSGKSFDGHGNYNLGIKEQIVFPEINYENVDKIRGLNITIVTNAKSDKDAKALLLAFKMPILN